jgi:two-component system invasion response regulator UvrY
MEKITIAMAEDHTILRQSLISLLELEDESIEFVAEAADGEELISKIKSLKEPPNVCILDINMPVKDGFETLVILRDTYPEMRFIVLTQHKHRKSIVRMLIAGANAFLNKDAEPAEVIKAIHTILEQPFYFNALVSSKILEIVRSPIKQDGFNLTENEMTFLKYCCSDLSYPDIAKKMKVSERTATYCRDSLFKKLGVNSRVGLAINAVRFGLVSIDELPDDTFLH